MIITLQKVQCWDPGSGYNVFLEKSADIDLSKLDAKKPTYVQVGPYRVKISVDDPSGGIKGLKIGGNPLASGSDAISGSVFMFLDDSVERVGMDESEVGVKGSASGCFEIHW